MIVPSEERQKRITEWVSCADEDLRLAQVGFSLSSGCPYRLLAYHAQQCAEKYLKAYLVLKDCDFPYTHNIGSLLDLCRQSGLPTEELQSASHLTRYATTARYPGTNEPVSKTEAVLAVETAEDVRKVLRASLEKEGVDL